MILSSPIYSSLLFSSENNTRGLAVLIDPDKFNHTSSEGFFQNLPCTVSHVFVGGSTVEINKTETVVKSIKSFTGLPVILFPGDHHQITNAADALLFLSLISGRNPEYLIDQQVKAVEKLRGSSLEIIPTGYILIDGGKQCAVERVSNTRPIAQSDVKTIISTALAGQYSGKKLIYLEAGSGAAIPVSNEIISAVKNEISIPLIVGGGIRNSRQLEEAYTAGADLVVIGTAFEEGLYNTEI